MHRSRTIARNAPAGLCVSIVLQASHQCLADVEDENPCKRPRSAGEPCTAKRKIWAAADFQNFLARPNSRRPRKKEVRKRQASIYRGSPSDAVEYFLVSHVTGWAILGYPALELDTGIFLFCVFVRHSLAAKFKFEVKKKNAIPGKGAWCMQCLRILVWFSFGNSSA